MNSEQREIRPFLGVDDVQSILQRTRLVVGSEEVEPGGTLDMKSFDFATAHVDLKICDGDEQLEALQTTLTDAVSAAGFEDDQVELVVVTSTPRLRIAEVLHQAAVGKLEAGPSSIMLSSPSARHETFSAPHGGARVDVFVCLATQLPPVALRPWRKGTWLGHVRFEIRTRLGEVGFTPYPLRDEERAKFGLTNETMRYVRFDSSAVDPEVDESSLEVYVDEELLAHMNQNPGTPGSKAFQRQLFIDAVAAIVLTVHREDQLEGCSIGDLDGSLIGRLITMAAGPDRGDTEVLNALKDDPALFLALVEARVKPRRDFHDTVTGAN